MLAIDFETASAKRFSPCSVGLAWISGGAIVASAQRLIRPHGTVSFNPFNTRIHHIAPQDVAAEPEFPQVWAEMVPHIAGKLLLAHNAAFDISVLRQTLDLYGLPYPKASYVCTCRMAQVLWPALPNHKLSTVADFLGLDLEHHIACSDAVAAGGIALAAGRQAKITDIGRLARTIGVEPQSL